MNNEVDATLEELLTRRAELQWMQIRTSQLPMELEKELAHSEALIAAAPVRMPALDASVTSRGW